MADNLLSALDMLSVSSAKLGERGASVPEVLGEGGCSFLGDYSGELAIEQFQVEIDSIDEGDAVGQATFRWKGGDSVVWEGSRITTSGTSISLRDGIKVKFSGSGFLKADRWICEARRIFGKASLLDPRPGEVWRSTGCTLETITGDLGQARQVQCMILGGHNLSEAAQATLKADDGPNWQSPAYSQALTVTSPHLLLFLGQTYRHWRLELADPANPAGYLEAAAWYLGGYTQPSRRMMQGASEELYAQRDEQRVEGGLRESPVGWVGDRWTWRLNKLAAADRQIMRSLFRQVHDRQTRPLWFLPDSEDLSGLLYGFLKGSLALRFSNPGRHATSLSFEEYGA